MKKAIKKQSNKKSLARSLVLKCGISPYLSGSVYLIEAIELYAEKEQSPMSIYRALAAHHSVTTKNIMRNIAYALSKNRELDKNLSEVMGFAINSEQIHNGLVIAYLAYKLNSFVA